MPIFAPSTHLLTHEVTNQPGPFAGYNLYLTDNDLREAAQREGGGWIEAPLRQLGDAVGMEEVLEMGLEANRILPELATYVLNDRRSDAVRFTHAYHALMMRATAQHNHDIARAQVVIGGPVSHAAIP